MTQKNPHLSAICWTTTAILTAFICFTQAAMMLSLLTGRVGIAWAAPVGLALALAMGYFTGRQMGFSPRQRIAPPLLTLAVLAFGLAFSAFYFDLSWDGQWYHQTGIYALANDWNPLADPMRAFPEQPNAELWVRHYPKGPWYVAAAIYDTTSHLEWGKCINVMAWAATALATFAAALDYGLRRTRAAAIALVVALNPVVMSEITTYLVDGIMISFLTVVIAAIFGAFRKRQPVVILVALLAAIVSINAKFTGLVFLCFIFAAGALWCTLQDRKSLLRYGGLALLALFLGTAVWGYNPYITNTLYRYNPFYPLSGSTTFPSLSDQGKLYLDPNETPRNFVPHNRFVRLFLATFGRPGNQPYHKELNSELMWPFAARPADLFYYHYHETRVAGFGPWFSGALLLSLALSGWLLLKRTTPRALMILVALTIISSLLISPFFWWARYGPQLWLLPILPALFVFYAAPSRWALRTAWLLVALLLANTALVTATRLTWETSASQTLRQQLTDLHQSGKEYAFFIPNFRSALEGRLQAWHVNYKIGDRTFVGNGPRLMSMVDDYPSPVRYRVVPETTTRPAK